MYGNKKDKSHLCWLRSMCRLSDRSREKSLIMRLGLFIFRPVDPDGFVKHSWTHDAFEMSNQLIQHSRKLVQFRERWKKKMQMCKFCSCTQFANISKDVIGSIVEPFESNQSYSLKENAHGWCGRTLRAHFSVQNGVSSTEFSWKPNFSLGFSYEIQTAALWTDNKKVKVLWERL